MSMTKNDQAILSRVAEQLAQEMSEQQLLREIGLRARTFSLHPAAASSLAKTVPEATALARAWDDLEEYGNWIFRRLHCQLRTTLPAGGNDSDGNRLRRAFDLTELAGSAAIVSTLTETLGVAPAIASVVAALAMKRAANPGWQETYLRPPRQYALAP